jgi:hypothetical protein
VRWAVLGSKLPANRHFLGVDRGTRRGTSRALPGTRGVREELGVVELTLVGQDVRVGVSRYGEVPLADPFADPRPGESLRVEQRNAPVAEVVRREQRDRCRAAGLRYRRPQSVAARLVEQASLRPAVLPRPERGFERLGERRLAALDAV